jgi:Flp pilus assembly protein TadD
MRPVALGCLVLTLLGAQAQGLRAASKASRAEVRFGVDVARRGLWVEARFRFERAAELDPENAAAFNNLAVACEQQGDFAAAREAYEQALRLEPGQRQIEQNFELFREADDKRNRDAEKDTGEAR